MAGDLVSCMCPNGAVPCERVSNNLVDAIVAAAVVPCLTVFVSSLHLPALGWWLFVICNTSLRPHYNHASVLRSAEGIPRVLICHAGDDHHQIGMPDRSMSHVTQPEGRKR